MELDNLDNLEVDDVLPNAEKKKRKNSKKKGNRVELQLTKILTAHFGKTFSRSVGSGNRWGQVQNLPSHAKTALTGDICPPEDFKWVIECKGGYGDDIDFNAVVVGMDCAMLDAFIKQSTHDHGESGRNPIIVWKQARRPWMAIVREPDIPFHKEFTSRLHYKGWVAVPLTQLLEKTPEAFWFEQMSS